MKNSAWVGVIAVMLCGCASKNQQAKTKPVLTRPWIGGHFETVATPPVVRTNAAFGKQGALLTVVHKEAPLDKAGLQEADLVLAINGQKVKSETEIRDRIDKNGASPSTLTIYRAGEILEKSVTPGTERYEKWNDVMVSLGFHTRFEIDVFPDPEFNLAAVGFEKNRDRLDLRDPKARYEAELIKQGHNGEWKGMRSDEGWKFWLGPFAYAKHLVIHSQEQ